MARLTEFLRNPFASLFQRSPQADRLSAYVIREHERGRPLAEILEDPYVRNRSTPQERERLLEKPEVVRAVGGAAIDDARDRLS